jgi:hypothetical protein
VVLREQRREAAPGLRGTEEIEKEIDNVSGHMVTEQDSEAGRRV